MYKGKQLKKKKDFISLPLNGQITKKFKIRKLSVFKTKIQGVLIIVKCVSVT